jgi:hypothetical protein
MFQQRAWSITEVPHLIHDEQKRSGLRTTIEITRVINGTWHGRSAVFIGLTVSHTERLIHQTTVRIDVSAGGFGDVAPDNYFDDLDTHQPIIAQFAPKKHYGAATDVDQSREVNLEGKLAGPSVITGSGITGSVKKSTSFALQRRQVIRTYASSEAGQSTKTILTLKAKENKVTRDGVYDELPMGIIIDTRNKPVVLTAKVTPRQGVSNKVLKHRSGKYCYSAPVCIDTEDWVGDGLPAGLTREMEQWDDTVWRSLVEYGEDYESVSTCSLCLLFSSFLHQSVC